MEKREEMLKNRGQRPSGYKRVTSSSQKQLPSPLSGKLRGGILQGFSSLVGETGKPVQLQYCVVSAKSKSFHRGGSPLNNGLDTPLRVFV